MSQSLCTLWLSKPGTWNSSELNRQTIDKLAKWVFLYHPHRWLPHIQLTRIKGAQQSLAARWCNWQVSVLQFWSIDMQRTVYLGSIGCPSAIKHGNRKSVSVDDLPRFKLINLHKGDFHGFPIAMSDYGMSMTPPSRTISVAKFQLHPHQPPSTTPNCGFSRIVQPSNSLAGNPGTCILIARL